MKYRHDLWLDPSARFVDWETTSLLKWAITPCAIRRGERISVGDQYAGFWARADVLRVETNGLVKLRVDPNTVVWYDTNG